MPTTRNTPAPTSPPADVEMLIRVRAARAQFAAAVAAAMLANVAAGVAPRWWKDAEANCAGAGSFDRWTACDHLEGLLHFAGSTPYAAAAELRELLLTAARFVPPDVYRAGCTLADTLEAARRT